MKLRWVIVGGQTVTFALALTVIWIDEYFDLPRVFFGAVSEPYRVEEYWIEAAAVVLVATVVGSLTLLLLGHIEHLERFIKICGWCKKIKIEDKWIQLEEYMQKEHHLHASHGICDECKMRLVEESRRRRAEEMDRAP